MRTTAEWVAHFEEQAKVAHASIHGSAVRVLEISVKHEPKVWLKWVREQLAAMGMTAGSKDVTLWNLHRYAYVIASEILRKRCKGEPLFCIPEILEGDDELAYWRAVAIYAAKAPELEGFRRA